MSEITKVTEKQYILLTNKAKVFCLLQSISDISMSILTDHQSSELSKAYNIIDGVVKSIDSQYEIGDS